MDMHQRNTEFSHIGCRDPTDPQDRKSDVAHCGGSGKASLEYLEPDRFCQTLQNIICLLEKLNAIDNPINKSKPGERGEDGVFTDILIDQFVAQDAMDKVEFHRIELDQAKAYIRHLLEERERIISRSSRGETKRLKQVQDELQILKQKHTVVEAELQLAREELRNVLKLNAAVRQRNAELVETNESLKGENIKFKGRLAVLRSDISKKNGQLQSVSQRQSEEMLTARHSARAKDIECSHLLVRIRELQEELTEWRQKNEGMQTRFDHVRGELEISHSQLREAKETNDKVEFQNEQLRDQVKELHGNVKSLHADHQKLAVEKKTNDSHESTISSLINQLADARADTLSARAEAKQVATQLESLKEKFVASVTRERALKAELSEARVREVKESVEETNTVQAAQLDSLKGVYMTKFKKMQKTINELNDKIYELERRELTRAPVIVSARRSTRDLKPLCIEIDEESESASVRSLPPIQAGAPPTTTSTADTRYRKPMRGLIDSLDPEPVKVNLDFSS